MMSNCKSMYYFSIKGLGSLFVFGILFFLFKDCMAAGASQVSSVLAPVKKEINDYTDFGIGILWLVALALGAIAGANGKMVIAFTIGILVPSVFTALALAHKFS